jgi:hypothetical protein
MTLEHREGQNDVLRATSSFLRWGASSGLRLLQLDIYSWNFPFFPGVS